MTPEELEKLKLIISMARETIRYDTGIGEIEEYRYSIEEIINKAKETK